MTLSRQTGRYPPSEVTKRHRSKRVCHNIGQTEFPWVVDVISRFSLIEAERLTTLAPEVIAALRNSAYVLRHFHC